MSAVGGTPYGRTGVIVVGVDGSGPSEDALRWAAGQARLTGARLRVVLSWEIPSAAYLAPLPTGLDLEKDARKVLDDEVADVLGEDPGIEIEKLVAEGHPAPVLLDYAEQADLLVVGSRGHGQFTGMLIGSVSEHVVSHAACPVVVVRHLHHSR